MQRRPIVTGGVPYMDIRPRGRAEAVARPRCRSPRCPASTPPPASRHPSSTALSCRRVAIGPATSARLGPARPGDESPHRGAVPSLSRRNSSPTSGPRFAAATSPSPTRPCRRGWRSSTRARRVCSGPTATPWVSRSECPTVREARTLEVIGVVRDIPLTLRDTGATPVIYMSYLQQPRTFPQAGAHCSAGCTSCFARPAIPSA